MKSFGGPWSDAKLACVEAYAKSYLDVMQNQPWATLHYVDAFAGCGRQRLRSASFDSSDLELASLLGDDEMDRADACRFIEGSPTRVMRASLALPRGFDQFVFVDADAQSCAELEARMRAEFGPGMPSSKFIRDDANRYLEDYAATYDSSRFRSLVFLDPFGCEVAWDTVAALAATRACDVWYLFPLSGVIRMLTHSGNIDPKWQARLDTIFGTPDWRDRFYSESGQTSLFDDVDLKRDASAGRVTEFIVERLEGVFAGVAKPAVLRNSKNSPMFALVFAVANPAAKDPALRIANHLTRKLSAQS